MGTNQDALCICNKSEKVIINMRGGGLKQERKNTPAHTHRERDPDQNQFLLHLFLACMHIHKQQHNVENSTVQKAPDSEIFLDIFHSLGLRCP